MSLTNLGVVLAALISLIALVKVLGAASALEKWKETADAQAAQIVVLQTETTELRAEVVALKRESTADKRLIRILTQERDRLKRTVQVLTGRVAQLEQQTAELQAQQTPVATADPVQP